MLRALVGARVMPPPVRIEARAWDDPRFDKMGRALGIHRDLALILTARVWAYQTEEAAPTLPPDIFDLITGIDGSSTAAIDARLADLEPDGTIRPRGTDGLAWLSDWRDRGRAAGGRARAAKARRGEHGEFLPAQITLPGVVTSKTPATNQRSQQQTRLPTSITSWTSSLFLFLFLFLTIQIQQPRTRLRLASLLFQPKQNGWLIYCARSSSLKSQTTL